jgi:monoterpene epsilon-lactone hydrolase
MEMTSAFCGAILFGGFVFAGSLAAQTPAGQTAAPPAVKVDGNGTVTIPREDVPVSKFLSPEGKAYLTQHLLDMQNPDMTYAEKGVPRFLQPYLARQRALYAVDLQDTKMAGVHVFVYTPKAGVSAGNPHRVLINLHGGGFSGCWPGCAELESRPVAALARMKVVSVDYRQGPENKFPAASEDVASVYQELLKDYKPKEIGIFGCSAGGMLTGESIAWFEKQNLPMPGAVGVFCASLGRFGGDAAYTSTPLGEGRMMPDVSGKPPLGYFKDVDENDPLAFPLNSPAVLSRFPPTLIITGTRGFEMSGAVYTHTQLVKAGVNAELHVWEGMFHGFFYNPDVPESQEAYQVMVKFFDRYLGE